MGRRDPELKSEPRGPAPLDLCASRAPPADPGAQGRLYGPVTSVSPVMRAGRLRQTPPICCQSNYCQHIRGVTSALSFPVSTPSAYRTAAESHPEIRCRQPDPHTPQGCGLLKGACIALAFFARWLTFLISRLIPSAALLTTAARVAPGHKYWLRNSKINRARPFSQAFFCMIW